MIMKMAKVKDCNAGECAYNMKNRCNAIAITVGGSSGPVCDTSMLATKKGGVSNMKAGVGACKVENCQFNKFLECAAKDIQVKMHTDHAECNTFKGR